MARFKAKTIVDASPGARGQSSVHDEARAPLMILFERDRRRCC